MPNGAFNICCPRDCVSWHNGGTSGAPLKPLRVDSALRALSTINCRETQSLGQQMLNAPVGINGSICKKQKSIYRSTLTRCRSINTRTNDFLIPFKLQGIWLQWHFSILSWTKRNTVWSITKRKTVTTIKCFSIEKESEIHFSECLSIGIASSIPINRYLFLAN